MSDILNYLKILLILFCLAIINLYTNCEKLIIFSFELWDVEDRYG